MELVTVPCDTADLIVCPYMIGASEQGTVRFLKHAESMTHMRQAVLTLVLTMT
jgi:hypothetical protein